MQIIHSNDAGWLSTNQERALVVLKVSRQDIDSQNVGRALDALLALIDSQESYRLYKESLSFMVEGFDYDPRPLSSIPEVCAYFERLTAEWPHWIWFLSREIGSFQLLMTLLCDTRVVQKPNGEVCTQFMNLHSLDLKILELFRQSTPLRAEFQVSDKEAIGSLRSAAHSVGVAA